MHAIILDIDGTLVDSNAIDGVLYADAIARVLGPIRLRDEWSDYEHVTDSGILADIFRDNDVSSTAVLAERIQDVFVAGLRDHIARCGPLSPVPGALEFVQNLAGSPHPRVAYATGGWEASAKLKLETSGFPTASVPMATADDAVDRRHIMRAAFASLEGEFTRVTYYGDGQWDRDAADSLGWHFVGVGERLAGIPNFLGHTV